MEIRYFARLVGVFLCQAAFGIGYVMAEAYKNIFGIGYVIIPLIGYVLVAYRLRVFRNVPGVSRAIVAVATSGVVWYVSGWVITLAIVWMGLVKPR